MITYRTFRNTDPPSLAEVWRSRATVRGLLQPMSAVALEQLVIAKPYFDSAGLIVCEEDGQVLGFAHAGFGPNEAESQISTDLGVTCLVLVRPHPLANEIADTLLRRSEVYLRGQGTQVFYAGCIRPLTPFYWGLYGGSELPGVLYSDPDALQLYTRNNYREIDRVVILRRDLTTFRPIIDRKQTLIRRNTRLVRVDDPPSRTWWEACTQGLMTRTRFELHQGPKVVAAALYWDLEPLASSWGVRAHGLIDVEVRSEHRRQGLATYLLGESFRELYQQGITLIEAQTMLQNSASLPMYERLGFSRFDEGAVLRKDSS